MDTTIQRMARLLRKTDKNPGSVVGYCRVSTEQQTAGLQITQLKQYGIDRSKIYVEGAMSGRTDPEKRPVFSDVLKRLKSGDTLVVWKMDRLGRSTIEILKIIKHLNEEGINLVSLTEHLDSRTPAGRLQITMLSGFAQYESELIRERVVAGLESAVENGATLGRPRSLSDEELASVRDRLARGEKSGALAREYGVTDRTIRRLRGSAPKGWRNYTPEGQRAYRQIRQEGRDDKAARRLIAAQARAALEPEKRGRGRPRRGTVAAQQAAQAAETPQAAETLSESCAESPPKGA